MIKGNTQAVSVLDNGAVADGTSDNTAAFQKAVDAAAKTGEWLIFLPVNFELTAVSDYTASTFKANTRVRRRESSFIIMAHLTNDAIHLALSLEVQ